MASCACFIQSDGAMAARGRYKQFHFAAKVFKETPRGDRKEAGRSSHTARGGRYRPCRQRPCKGKAPSARHPDRPPRPIPVSTIVPPPQPVFSTARPSQKPSMHKPRSVLPPGCRKAIDVRMNTSHFPAPFPRFLSRCVTSAAACSAADSKIDRIAQIVTTGMLRHNLDTMTSLFRGMNPPGLNCIRCAFRYRLRQTGSLDLQFPNWKSALRMDPCRGYRTRLRIRHSCDARYRGSGWKGEPHRLPVVDLVMPKRGSLAQSWHILGTNDFDIFQPIDSKYVFLWCREGGSNPHGREGRRILSPLRLPVSNYI